MIVSYDHKFIFIKTAKTAGTSVEILLSSYCGPKDVITPLGLPDESLRYELNGRRAQNFSEDESVVQALHAAFDEGDEARYEGLMKALRQDGAFYNHIPARKALKNIEPSFWASALKFTIERHPYEKAVSRAFFKLGREGLPESEFENVLEALIDANRSNDRQRYVVDGEVVVDQFIRFENLQDDLGRVLAGLGLPFSGELPQAKGTFRTDRRPAREILTERQKRRIYRTCRETFEAFGYER